jgi:hypothetical protein
VVESFEAGERPDVQRHLGLKHALCGYIARVGIVPSAAAAPANLATLEVRAGDDERSLGLPLPMTGPLAQRLSGDAG